MQSGNSTPQTDNNVKAALDTLSSVLLGNTNIATVEERFQGKVKENKDSIFQEEPVDIETFLYNPEYLGLNITLSKPQIEFVNNMSRIFETPMFTEGVLQSGQGSGKDTCSIFINLRIVYLLWCLNSPQTFFKMADNSFIDLINVAPTSDIARNIYFATLTNIVKDSPLFQNKIEASVTSSVINFPKNIRLISGNSENESWQGYTPILVILDEIDAFKSEIELNRSKSLRSEGAEGVYNTAKALVQSRFPGVGKIVSLSWPRFKGSFIQRRFAAGKLEEKTYVAAKTDGNPYCTWEFNPTKSKDDFEDFYKTDPVLAQARFECNPPYARDAFIKDPVPVLRAFEADIDESDVIVHAALKPIRSEYNLTSGVKYYVHVDLGQNHSNAALGIAHKDKDMVVIDLLKVWEPEPDHDIELRDIQNFIVRLKDRGFKLMEVTYDKFQSLDSIQQLQNMNINAKYKSVTRTAEAYDTFKDLVYQEKIDGYFDAALIEEILGLERILGDRIDARPGFKKDRADAVVGAVHGAIQGQGITRIMKNMGNIQDVFGNSSPSRSDRLSGNAQEHKEFEQKKEAIMAQLEPTSSNSSLNYVDRCDNCGRTGGIEFSFQEVRVALDEDSDKKRCLVCTSSWRKTNSRWMILSEPDEEELSKFGGTW